MVEFTAPLETLKRDLLRHFRERAVESSEEIRQKLGEQQYKKRANAINKAIRSTHHLMLRTLEQRAVKLKWGNDRVLPIALMLQHTRNVVMIESRNVEWPYEYMAFSRRIGELWEPFCKLCFDYPTTEIELFVPPLFADVRRLLKAEVTEYIDELALKPESKEQLKAYYQKVWSLVGSGEIKLELDLHFRSEDGTPVNVDFKSGFASNEKGNTNRLLMVATIYRNLEQGHRCVLLVRSPEDENNAYFRTIAASGVWDAYCGDAAYEEIGRFSGFELKGWVEQYVTWEDDFDDSTYQYLRENNLLGYLVW